ncbi:MAG TPA: hypothetical protein DCX54_10580 [Flavobacteriales bacterium]|nr:hypothetical protein [Flavobacteriales bacterium]
MIISRHRLLLLFSLVVLIAGCEGLKKDGRLSEGIIEYNVSYPKLDPNSVLIELLPTKMTLFFKDDLFKTDLSAGFGMFRMNVIVRNDDKKVSQMVKLINDRFVVNYDEEAAIESNRQFPEIRLEHTGNLKTIAGYQCKEAIVTVLNDSNETYSIYYTDQIKLLESNWFTQYTELEGVLMEYQVERYNLCSRFTASKVTATEIDDDVFSVPEEYKEIEEQEMNDKMQEIFDNFSE